jgi:hypothetical protein
LAFCSLRSPILANYFLPVNWALYLQGGFVKLSILFSFILFFTIDVMAKPCDIDNSNVYLNFISDLKKQINPIERFNLKYLVEQLRFHGIQDDEISGRIAGYTSTIYQLHENITVIALFTPSGDRCNNYIYKVTGAPSGYENYVSVSLVDSKIVNVSFEANDTTLEGKRFSQLPFIGVK